MSRGDTMGDIKERLDNMKIEIQKEEFLKGEGLSNEVNIRMFCYDPQDEMVVRYFVDELLNEKLNCTIKKTDLYKVFLSICEDRRILDRIPKLEEKRGKEFIEDYLKKSFDAKMFAEKINNEFNQEDILLLTGVGKVFPFVRVHSLLEALQPYFINKPIIVMYPGTFDNHFVKLFNELKPNPYYRAFNMF